ncbi:ATP-binding protein [Thiotrichales bacterium HSG1]|nr:ATP-binding protein [Thiotrichales bacterium HSG1]
MPNPIPPQKNSLKDFIIILVISVLAFLIAGEIDAFELLVEFAHQYEDWEIDEIFTLSVIVAISLGVFSWRRWRETKQELIYRKWVQSQLKIAKDEADIARKQAETANQTKSEFLASMSHELRTPLNGILGYAQILRRDKTLNNQQQDAIHTMQKSGEHLLTLINDILDLSKIEAHKMELNTKIFQLPEFLKDIIDMIQIKVHQGIKFEYKFCKDLPIAVEGDEVRLRQVLVNLLGNAIKFTTQGRVYFQVSCQTGKFHFKIQDTGHGIAPEQLQTIFEPFRQAGGGFVEGTGLGLPISKRFIEMMGGKIQVQSVIGEGSIFEFELQLPKVKDWQPEIIQQHNIIGFKSKQNKILIVDDKIPNRMVMISLLTPLGFILKEAENGKQGIEIANEFLPDVIIMDLVMPVMDGLDAIKHISKISELEHTTIIGASASAFDINRSECFAAGCHEFIAKPIQTDELLDKIGKNLELEWLYEESEMDISDISLEMIAPSTDIVQKLYDLVLEGDIDAISEQVVELKNLDDKYIPFAKQLQQLADEFDLDKLQTFVESYLN